MRSLRLKEGFVEGRQTLAEGGRLIRRQLSASLLLGLVLAVLPAVLRAFLVVRANTSLIALWDSWMQQPSLRLGRLITVTLGQIGRAGLWATALDLANSLLFSPLLLSALALLYNGYVHAPGRQAVVAVQTAGKQFRTLIFVALACMLAEWFVQMVPSVASGLLSLLAEMLSWIPILGSVAGVLSVVLSVLISLLTDFAVVVIFCYVWICAACEGVPGFGALVRSWQLTRNQMHRTIAALLMLTLLRWLLVLVFAGLFLLLSRLWTLSATVLVYIAYIIGAAYTVMLGAVTSALYQRRPLAGGPRPGQFRSSGPDMDTMKRANID